MAFRGIDTQMLATKPTEMTGQQTRIQKQTDLHMQQTAVDIHKKDEAQKERTVALVGAEGKKIGTEERETGSGRHKREGRKQEAEVTPAPPARQDPLLGLPVEKGKFAKAEHHYIDVSL